MMARHAALVRLKVTPPLAVPDSTICFDPDRHEKTVLAALSASSVQLVPVAAPGVCEPATRMSANTKLLLAVVVTVVAAALVLVPDACTAVPKGAVACGLANWYMRPAHVVVPDHEKAGAVCDAAAIFHTAMMPVLPVKLIVVQPDVTVGVFADPKSQTAMSRLPVTTLAGRPGV